MPQDYRAYVIGTDGRVSKCDFEAENDDAAKEHAKTLVNGNDVELWKRDRKIAFFKYRA